MGKSTLSCAVALRLSKEDKSLLVSIDPAHSLSGILGMPIGHEVKKIKENLHALELSAERLVEEYTERVLNSLQDLLPHVRSGLKEYAKYLKHSPTALETAILDHLLDLCQDYAYVVVDSAPTGQMLRLFETAHMVKGWFDFLTRLAKEREKVQAFMGKRDSLLSLIEERKSRVERLLNILREKKLGLCRGQRRAIIFGGSPRDKKVLKGYEGVYSFEPLEVHGGRFYKSSRGRKALWD